MDRINFVFNKTVSVNWASEIFNRNNPKSRSFYRWSRLSSNVSDSPLITAPSFPAKKFSGCFPFNLFEDIEQNLQLPITVERTFHFRQWLQSPKNKISRWIKQLIDSENSLSPNRLINFNSRYLKVFLNDVISDIQSNSANTLSIVIIYLLHVSDSVSLKYLDVMSDNKRIPYILNQSTVFDDHILKFIQSEPLLAKQIRAIQFLTSIVSNHRFSAIKNRLSKDPSLQSKLLSIIDSFYYIDHDQYKVTELVEWEKVMIHLLSTVDLDWSQVQPSAMLMHVIFDPFYSFYEDDDFIQNSLTILNSMAKDHPYLIKECFFDRKLVTRFIDLSNIYKNTYHIEACLFLDAQLL